MTTDARKAPPAGATTLPDGTLLIVGPSPEVPQWQRDTMQRQGSTAASSTRELRRRVARELRRQQKRDRKA